MQASRPNPEEGAAQMSRLADKLVERSAHLWQTNDIPAAAVAAEQAARFVVAAAWLTSTNKGRVHKYLTGAYLLLG